MNRRDLFRKMNAALLLAAAACLPAQANQGDPAALNLKGGVLKVAVYKDFAPFSDKSGGIDVELAQALADKLGAKLSLLPFDAGENLNDDLRNMVWKGHYLGYGPADVMLHVPVDRGLMQANRQVEILAPYYRESVRVVRDVRKIPDYNGPASMAGKAVGVEKVSIGAMVVLGENSLRGNAKIFDTSIEALQKLKAGEVDAVVANRSEIDSVIQGDPNFVQSEPGFERLPRQGWAIGMAVRKDNAELGKAIQAITAELFSSGEMARIFRKYGVQPVQP